MVEVFRKLKVNRRYAGSACGWCGDALALGEDGAVCEACEAPHHARCWGERAGCGRGDCVNAPLQVLTPAPRGRRQPGPYETWCPYCGKIIRVDKDICRYCNEIVSADGLYHGERRIPREAKVALMYGIVGFFAFSLILGPAAFMRGRDAKRRIAVDPRLRGRAVAVAAQCVGVADVMLALLALPLLVQWLSK